MTNVLIKALLLAALALAPSALFASGDHDHDHDDERRHAEQHGHDDEHPGRTTISAEAAEAAGITTERVGPALLHQTVTLTGRIVPAADRHYRVAARFPGIVQSVPVEVGQQVEAGDTLAIIESRDSLQRYAVKAPAAGVVLARDVSAGSAAGDGVLFEIVDLSQLWVELAAFPSDLTKLARGQSVQLRDVNGVATANTAIDWIAPNVGAAQSAVVRVPVANGDGRWRIGQHVTAEAEIASVEVPLAVRSEAIQRIRNREVVFAHYAETYEVRMIEIGRRTGDYVEVLGGIEPGTEYVVGNSYLVKADVLKSGASHDH